MAASPLPLSCATVFIVSVACELFVSNFKTYYGIASTLPSYKASRFPSIFGCTRWCSEEACCYAYQFSNANGECHLLTRQNLQNITLDPNWNIAAKQALEYKCLLANLTMASWMPFQAMRATYAFDCSYMYHRNRPIFRKVGGRHYLSYHGTDNLQIGTDRFPRYANVWFQGYRSYLPFDSIKMPAYYFNYTRRAWIRAPANVLRVTCIEDNNY